MTPFLSLLTFPSALFAQVDFDYSVHRSGHVPPIVWVIDVALAVLMIAAMWKLFTKAGQPGWAAIIPIVNLYFLCKVASRPGWWLILLLLPCVNIVVLIVLDVDIAKVFGKGVGFAIGLIFLPFIFYPILGFGSATYQGPATPAT